MDRTIVYVDENPLDTDFLNAQKNAMIGLGMALQAILGTGTLVDGLACSPTGPASLQVVVAPGSIYSYANIDGTAYGSLDADTTHQIVKQGISLGTTTLNCPAPATTGFAINYLIQAAYQDVDTGSTILPYYDATNPAVAYSGPDNTGISQNTVREGQCVISVKAGTAATTGTQTTPAPDAGFTGLWVVTVDNGQTAIISGDIVAASGAPFIATKLTALAPLASPALTGVPTVPTAASGTNTTQAASTAFVQTAVGSGSNTAQPESGITHGRNVAWASNTTINGQAASIILKNSAGQTIKVSSPSGTLNSATTGANGLDTGSVAANSTYYIWAIYNPTTTTFAWLLSLSSSAPTLPSGYTYSALVSLAFTDGSGHFIGFDHLGSDWQYHVGNNLAALPIIASGSAGSVTAPTWTTPSISSVIPAIASKGNFVLFTADTGGPVAMLAPNSSYGAATSTSNPPPMVVGSPSGFEVANNLLGEFVLTGTTVAYAATSASCGVAVLGFTLNI